MIPHYSQLRIPTGTAFGSAGGLILFFGSHASGSRLR